MASCSSGSPFGLQFISEFRIVLLGNRGAGKTSLANMILSRQTTPPKRTAVCVKIRGVAAGRLLTVVDTPGWWKNFLANETPEFQKQELRLSLAHCPPGPHAVLLVIRVDALYKEKNKRSAQEHLELLGEDVWKHTIVIFTYGDHLQDQTVEQHFGGEGEASLQWLVDKCGNRYHIVNIDSYNSSQVKELIEKIEEVVAVNSGCHYEMDRKYLHEVKEMRKVSFHQRACKRRRMVEEQRGIHEGRNCCLSTVRMVLLGHRRAGKSAARNTIFGRENFDYKRTTQCVKTQDEVAGKLVVVIDTPGWWRTLPARDTPVLDKQEILLSMSLCPPGPHAVLLALRSDIAFTEKERKSVEEHMDLLGEGVWKHTILLFTHGDLLGDATLEQYIDNEGKDLKMLVAKCRNRYHVLNNNNLVDATQVTQLLEKVEEIVAENGGFYYVMDQRIYKEVKRKMRSSEKKAKMRRKMKKQSGVMSPKKVAAVLLLMLMGITLTKPFMGAGQHLSEISLVLLGYGEAGKTSTGNTILGTAEFGWKRTSRCVKKHGEVAGRLLTVVDTPGWWKHLPIEHTPQANKQEIAQSVSLTSSGPITFLLVLRLDSSFQEEEKRAVEDHLMLFGRGVWDQTVVLFTCGDWLGDRSIELHIEAEGKALQWLLGKCGNRYHVLSNKNRRGNAQVTELLEKIEELMAENKMCRLMDMWDLKKKAEMRRLEDTGTHRRTQNRIEELYGDVSDLDDDVFIIDTED